MDSKVKVTLIKSPIGSLPKQKAVLAALGLRKLHQSKVFVDNAALQGQIALVSHMLKVEKEG